MALELNGTTGVSAVQAGAVESGDLPAGSVIQVVETTDSSQQFISSTSLVNTDLVASITPVANTSKIFVQCLLHVHIQTGELSARLNLSRDENGVYTNLTNSSQDFRVQNASGDFIYLPVQLFVLDSPNTTSEVTYRVRARSVNGGGVEIFNDRGKGRLLLMEVAG